MHRSGSKLRSVLEALRRLILMWLLGNDDSHTSGLSQSSTQVVPSAARAERRESPVDLYLALVNVLRDQIADQLASANTNDLISVGAMGTGFAVAVAMLIVRATNPTDISYWWWYPLPLFLPPLLFFAVPMLPSGQRRKFRHGPSVPAFMQHQAGIPITVEQALIDLMKDLQLAFANNDALLERESRCFKWGWRLFVGATTISVGLYAWGLS